MNPTLDAFLRSWPFEPWLLAGIGLAGGVYWRGWLDLRRRNRQRWPVGRLGAFLGGLATIYLALASPIEPFASLLLQVHMLQHLLLMMAAPPLLWLGTPFFPLLRGLPRPMRMVWIAPLLRSVPVRAFFTRLTHPALALTIYVTTIWIWHAPQAYELALRSADWHYVQHACFLAAGLLFWYPVVRPYPSRPSWSAWLLLPYLILADLQNTVLSALLTFANRVLYPHYLDVPRLNGLSALEDQCAAGVLMWVPGSVAFLAPLFVIGFRLMYGREPGARSQESRVRNQESGIGGRIALPLYPALTPDARPLTPDSRPLTPGLDLLRLPLIGRFLRWRHARLAMQIPLLGLAGILILDGLRGPQVGAMNLAGVLPWIHWRGLLIVGLLTTGNFFCMACPFLVPRTLARRWLPTGRSWPRWLRSKWLAVALLSFFLWAYEAFSLWDSPWWTAWLALGYFALAFVIDGFFRGASFCKYVCPIGQFNFVQSLVSPLEVKVRDAAVCASCRTKDCIRGNDETPGCEMRLILPRKVGNMDCTFCLDCIHACPHDNIGISAKTDGAKTGKRLDVAVLIVVLTFGAFVNAAGMVAPVLAWRDALAVPLLATGLFYVVGLLLIPLGTVGGAALVSRRLDERWTDVVTRFSYALIPLGFSMWLAHYSFHLLTSWDAIIPAAQRFAADWGVPMLGDATWIATCCRPVGDWLPRLEIVILDVGLLFSLRAAYRIASQQSPHWPRALAAFAPWAALIVALFAVGIWIVLQPMQMRGALEM